MTSHFENPFVGPPRPNQQPPERPSPEELMASMNALSQEVNTANTTVWEELYPNASPEAQARIDVVSDEFIGAIEDPENAGKNLVLSSFFTARDTQLLGDFLPALYISEQVEHNLNQTRTALNEYANEKANDILAKSSALARRIDYDKLLEITNDPDNLITDSAKYAAVLAQAIQTAEPDYARFVERENSLSDAEQILTQAEILRDTEEISVQEEPTEQPVDTYKKAWDYTYRYVDLHNDYYTRADDTHVEHIRQVLRTYSQHGILHPISELGKRIPYPPAFTHAIQRKLTSLMNVAPLDTNSAVYLRAVEASHAIDSQTSLDNLAVFTDDCHTPLPFDQQGLKDFLKQSVPPLALQTIDTITFLPDIVQTADGRRHTGLNNRFDAAITIAGIDEFDKHMDTASAEAYIKKLLVHEYGHEFHKQLPVAALDRWQALIKSEPVKITQNAAAKHGTWHRHAEDFADSMALYVTNPAQLLQISPTRFNGMQQLYEEYMPSAA